MAVNQFRIEGFFDDEGLKYFRAGEDGDAGSWYLMFGNKTGLSVRLLEDGECVLIRSGPLVHLDEFEYAGKCRVWEAMAHRNDQMMVGRYSGTESVVVEAALPIEDGDISDKQLKRLLGVVVNESNQFGAHLRRIVHDETVDVIEDPIDGLMRQLIEGDSSSANFTNSPQSGDEFDAPSDVDDDAEQDDADLA